MEMIAPAMTILLNGSLHPLLAPQSLTSLLADLGLAGKPVVVELNEVAILPRHYAATQITAGDRLEVVTLAAGG
ncbi:MAG: hypothetical protein RLZZ522_1502 [Verrucomicrobiota bacterium]|jgi:sulfur carrier protein